MSFNILKTYTTECDDLMLVYIVLSIYHKQNISIVEKYVFAIRQDNKLDKDRFTWKRFNTKYKIIQKLSYIIMKNKYMIANVTNIYPSSNGGDISKIV